MHTWLTIISCFDVEIYEKNLVLRLEEDDQDCRIRVYRKAYEVNPRSHRGKENLEKAISS